MKVICNLKSILNKEFEHDEELSLMREKNKNEIHLIRYVTELQPRESRSLTSVV
jgi:hypothetical protein